MKTPERDLSLLLAAVHQPPGPAPELLVRYADDPESLSEAERAEVVAAVRADPLIAGELRALQGASGKPPIGLGRQSPPRHGLRRRPSVVWVAGPVGASAAAALLALLWVAEPAPDPATSVSLSAFGETREPEPAMVAQSTPAPEASPAPAESPAPSAAPPATAPPTATAAVAQPPEPPADRLAEPSPTFAAAAEPPPAALPAPAEVSTPSAPEAPSAPVLVAVLEPQYRPPAGAPARYRGVTRAARAQGEGLDLEVLAPAHVALTDASAPSLFWSLDALPDDSAVFRLTLSAAMTPEPVLERSLPRPARAGLQRIRLASYGIELEPGVEYVWTISAEVAGAETLAQGWIQRTDPRPAASSAAPGEVPAYYAGAGLWYDAIEALADLADAHPEDERIQSALRTLRSQAERD